MESMIARLFIHNWQRKLLALISAIIIWLFVNHSITGTKTIPNIPVRVRNLPKQKTIIGLQPNGILGKRITLTLTGSKDVIEELEPGDLEIHLDASMADSDEWIIQINKKNLVSLDPAIDLANHINSIDHGEFVVSLSNILEAKIPIFINTPQGDPPPGYEYLDLWPQRLLQNVSGPEEEILKLKSKGLEVTFDLNDMTKAELDSIKKQSENGDEVKFIVPKRWKNIAIPFRGNQLEPFNDPEAQYLRIYFLKKQFLPVGKDLPIRVFYPAKTLEAINPQNYRLTPSQRVIPRDGVFFFQTNLFVKDVSRLFLDIIRENMEVTLIAAPKSERENLQWSLEVLDAHQLEDMYVAYLIANLTNAKNGLGALPKRRENLIRKRFREYLQNLTLYTEPNQKLIIESAMFPNQKEIKILNY